MEQFQYTIRDDLGIHARPAGLLVRLALGYSSTLHIARQDRQVSLKKIFTVMGLNVKVGDTVTISASGADEQQAIAALHDFFQQHL
ncbi:HPr family phosphocarrier protein [Raoultella sp. WB_B2P2-3]|jgi:phosphocarrier protein|uniref:HPr family phosphocarrier protein n=1 Tax=Raoultella TaxID=160674 RepID=UPI000BA30B2F|nr:MULTISPECIES: HPr family phosphocarrier protein [Enterobacteriaceae]MVT01329.1 HPr family phosphocarrier protein [Raoultella sp. 10-1]PAC13880.1 PTS galactitol transporter subunit IIC [Enterobacter sp. 10-1]